MSSDDCTATAPRPLAPSPLAGGGGVTARRRPASARSPAGSRTRWLGQVTKGSGCADVPPPRCWNPDPTPTAPAAVWLASPSAPPLALPPPPTLSTSRQASTTVCTRMQDTVQRSRAQSRAAGMDWALSIIRLKFPFPQ